MRCQLQQIVYAGLAGLRAETRKSVARQTYHPRVRILEQGSQLRRSSIGTRTEITNRFAGAVAGVAVGTGQQLLQRRHEIALAPAQCLRRTLPHRRRPTRQARQQLVGLALVVAVFAADGIEVAPGGNDVLDLAGCSAAARHWASCRSHTGSSAAARRTGDRPGQVPIRIVVVLFTRLDSW